MRFFTGVLAFLIGVGVAYLLIFVLRLFVDVPVWDISNELYLWGLMGCLFLTVVSLLSSGIEITFAVGGVVTGVWYQIFM